MSWTILQRPLVVLVLFLLTISAFLIRLQNFQNTETRSIDEILYYRMSKQLVQEGLTGYHTVPYGRELAATGRPLPPYFFQPLFKHPPLFSFLVALSIKWFGVSPTSAGYIPILLGVLMIPLTYWLGTLLFNRTIGLISACVLWLDPVSVMTSQKVWMDTTLGFFMLLALVLFVAGLKQRKDFYYILSGLACGFAALTKYTGIFASATIAVFAFIYRRELFKTKAFLISLGLPFLMLGPWFYWNYLVYGGRFLLLQKILHRNERLYVLLGGLLVVWLVLSGIFRIMGRIKEKSILQTNDQPNAPERFSRRYINMVLGVLLALAVFPQILYGLQFSHIPRTSWGDMIFKFEPPTFYIGQLLEYSLLYIFGFASIFIERDEKQQDMGILRIGTLMTILFFTAWRSFQCRYILFAVPLLIILAVELIMTITQKIDRIKPFLPRQTLKFALFLVVGYSLLKTFYIDLVLSFPNDMCYF